jgi:hypothetical protein
VVAVEVHPISRDSREKVPRPPPRGCPSPHHLHNSVLSLRLPLLDGHWDHQLELQPAPIPTFKYYFNHGLLRLITGLYWNLPPLRQEPTAFHISHKYQVQAPIAINCPHQPSQVSITRLGLICTLLILWMLSLVNAQKFVTPA